MMEIGRSDFDDSSDIDDEVIVNDLLLDSDDDLDDTLVKTSGSKLDVRRRLEQYFEDARLKRELDYY